MVPWTLARGLLAALVVLSSVPLSLGLGACFGGSSAYAQGVIQNIRVEGNKRVEPETVRSYLTFSTGDAYDPALVDESLKALFATGLFQEEAYFAPLALGLFMALAGMIIGASARTGLLRAQ